MTVEQHTPKLVRLERDALSERFQRAASHGAAAATADVSVAAMTGPAVADCLQGILTNDIVAPGNEAFVYGAVLTTKGMIVCDLWVAREGGNTWIFVPSHGEAALRDTFKRFVPPRLARYEVARDRAVVRVVGPRAEQLAADAGIAVPRPGRASRGTADGIEYHVARPSTPHGFELQLWCEREVVDTLLGALDTAGIEHAPPEALELARIVAGVPRLGAEIDHKTLPQEARFEELDGVSFSKGCYTGQETVARVHFRGHPNRWLAGLLWDEAPDPSDASVASGDKIVGRVTAVAWLHEASRWIGLGVVRREVEPGHAVTAGGRAARVRTLPHRLEG
jgi:folate-binding protein YgfZ